LSASAKINLFGFSVAYKMITEACQIFKKKDTATIIMMPPFNGTWEDYCDRYSVKVSGKKVLMYKTVHKDEDGTLRADYDKSFIYKIGETHELKNAPKSDGSCSYGLHIAHKSWAVSFGAAWHDCALIECEVDPKDIVVSDDCDGKVRTSKLTVIREVPKEEWYTLDIE
jgi:hypothetical protein